MLLGDGAGGFLPRIDRGVPGGPHGIATGDIDLDGIPDVATVNYDAGTTTLLVGTGSGTFLEYATVAAAFHPMAVTLADMNRDVLGDLNGDGNLDVAIVATNAVHVWIGHGDGTFTIGGIYATSGDPRRVALAHLDSDGRLDMMATSAAAAVHVWRGLGDGSFGPRTDLAAVNSTFGLAAADVNLDGYVDVVATCANVNTVSVYPGNATGGFGARADYASGNFPTQVTVANFDPSTAPKEYPDLLVSNGSSASVSLLRGTATGFLPAVLFTTAAEPFDVKTADLNGDGILDIVTANWGAANFTVLLGDGSGGVASRAEYGSTVAPAVAIADMNRDGRLDLVGSDALVLGRGDGTFWATQAYSMSTGPGVAVGDLSGDGCLDVIAVLGGPYERPGLSPHEQRVEAARAAGRASAPAISMPTK